MSVTFVISPLTSASKLNDDTNDRELITQYLENGHKSGSIDIDQLICIYTQQDKEPTLAMFQEVAKFEHIPMSNQAPMKLERKGISRVISTKSGFLEHLNQCISPMVYIVQKNGKKFKEKIFDNSKRRQVFEREVDSVENLIKMESEPQRCYKMEVGVENGSVTVSNFESYQHEHPSPQIQQNVPRSTILLFESALPVHCENGENPEIQQIVETLLNNKLFDKKDRQTVFRVFSSCSFPIGKEKIEELCKGTSYILEKRDSATPSLPLKVDKSGLIHKLNNNEWKPWKVDHGEIKPDFIVSVQNRKGKQSEVIITNDRVVVLCSDLQIDTAEAVSWSECYQAEVDSEAYITVRLQHADRQERDNSFEDFVPFSFEDSFEDFVPSVHSKQTPTSSAKKEKNQQRTQIMSDSPLSSCTPSPQSSPKKTPDDVLKELGLFMSPDTTPKKRQRHSTHEKDESSSSKKRKYHDESGVDQVKVGIDGQEDQYKANTVTIKPSDIRKAEMRGFVLRGFDQNIFDSVASVSARNMLHQTKTHSPIFVVASKETLQQMVVLEGTHRILSLLSRLEEPDQEDFEFEAVIYETSDEFAGIWNSCVELKVGQTAKADVCGFPPKMMHLVQTTYGREFAKSLARFSKKQQSDALAIILDAHLDSETKENIQSALYNKDTNPLFALYRKCFDEGLVAAEPRDTHVEKGPFLSYFMGPSTSKYFSEHMEQIFSTNKSHILVLKASIMDDEATVKACKNYIDKKVLGPKFREILNDIIRDDDDDEESAMKKKKVKGGAPESNFKSVDVENLEDVPEKTIVKFTETVTKDQTRILKEKKCSLILIGASTAAVDIGDLMQSLGGNVRMGVFVKTSFICIGPHIKKGQEVTTTAIHMLVKRVTEDDAKKLKERKSDQTIYSFLG